MHLIRRPFWWPWQWAGAIQTALPNAACPRLLQKPLDAGIGRLLAPYRPSGCQGNMHTNNNQQLHLQSWPFLMAMAMCRYGNARIAQWRRSRASLEATGRRHWASIMPNNIVRTPQRHFFLCFYRQNRRKRSRVDAKNPVFNRGMTYQMKEKGLINLSIYFVGGVTMIE